MSPEMRVMLLGMGNGALEYALVLLAYGAMFILMRFASARMDPAFRTSFWTLFWGWGVGTFIANYLLYLAGVMSFLPWLNNAFHTFLWIGLCLGFLYSEAHKHALWEQFAVYAIFSFIIKVAENAFLGTWELTHFFGIPGNTAYIVGWSLADGLYPVLSALGLKLVSRAIPGVVVPQLNPS